MERPLPTGRLHPSLEQEARRLVTVIGLSNEAQSAHIPPGLKACSFLQLSQTTSAGLRHRTLTFLRHELGARGPESFFCLGGEKYLSYMRLIVLDKSPSWGMSYRIVRASIENKIKISIKDSTGLDS